MAEKSCCSATGFLPKSVTYHSVFLYFCEKVNGVYPDGESGEIIHNRKIHIWKNHVWEIQTWKKPAQGFPVLENPAQVNTK